jgi:hypothetical protein
MACEEKTQEGWGPVDLEALPSWQLVMLMTKLLLKRQVPVLPVEQKNQVLFSENV